MPDRTVVVTGGTGFVGVHVVREFAARGFDVVVLDNARNSTAKHLAEVEAHARIHRTDILADSLNDLMRELRPFAVIHLAGFHQAAHCEVFRAETIRTNVEGTERVLQAAIVGGVERLFVASSSAVYARSDTPCNEEAAVGPSDLYGLTKVMNEQQVRLNAEKNPAVKFMIGRFFNVVGPFETSPRLAPQVIERALGGNRIAIGNLKPRRDYVHVKDVARAVAGLTLENERSIDVCNIGTGIHWSVEEVIGLVGEILGRPIEFETTGQYSRHNDRMLIAADISKIRRDYRWEPQYDLRAALTEAIDFAQSRRSQLSSNQ